MFFVLLLKGLVAVRTQVIYDIIIVNTNSLDSSESAHALQRSIDMNVT